MDDFYDADGMVHPMAFLPPELQLRNRQFIHFKRERPRPYTKQETAIDTTTARHHDDADTRGNPSAEAIVAYADGSSLKNPGPSGWAFVIVYADGTRKRRSGALENTTNNRAELRAAIEVLLELPENASGIIRLDSQYVVNGANEWRQRWVSNGWRNASGAKVANSDLFKTLFGLLDTRPGIRLEWVRGHAGDPLNELVDRLARAEAEKCGFDTPMGPA